MKGRGKSPREGFNKEVIRELPLKRQMSLSSRDEKGETRAVARMRTWRLEQAWRVQGRESFILCVAGQLHIR